MSDETLLRIEDVSVSFGGVAALQAMNLQVGRGEIVGLVGPNGAGKTTLINVITGYYRPDAGTVRLGEDEIVGRSPDELARLGVARTFQSLRLFEGTSVLDNVLVGRHTAFRGSLLQLWGTRRWEERSQRAVAMELLDLVDLADLAGADVSNLSYGTRRRVELARALALEPRLLLLDEPTAGMSGAESAEISDVVTTISASGVGVLLIDHNLKLIADACETTCVMVSGQPLVTGPTSIVFARDDVRAAYVGNRRKRDSDVS